MYEIDERDRVVELADVPQSSIGAPSPFVLASEADIRLAYYVEDVSPRLPSETVRIVTSDSEGETVCIVRFSSCQSHIFGMPNDEAISGHPLYGRGLESYGAFEVVESSWLRKLERVKSVHEFHDAKRFLRGLKHFIFSFHDSMFECIAAGFTTEVRRGSVRSMIPYMAQSTS